jgi:hypothetical protein
MVDRKKSFVEQGTDVKKNSGNCGENDRGCENLGSVPFRGIEE